MKRIAYSIIFTLFCFVCSAQQQHFVYIQTENQQPFSVRLGTMVLSSSASGYLIIPKLDTGKCELNIGFPKNEWPNQKIQIEVQKDQGYVLKNFDSKGWGLFNIQKMNVVMNNNGVENAAAIATTNDGFANALADVVGSPSIKEQPQKKPDPEPVKPPITEASAPERAPQKEDAPVISIDSAKSIVEKKIVGGSNESAYHAPVKLNSFLDRTGRSMVYVDSANGATDTIRVFIPYPEIVAADPVMLTPKTDTLPAKPIVIEAKKDTVLSEPTPVIKEEVKPVNTPPPAQKISMINSDCREFASDKDFLKLRKKMAAQKSEENMVIIAQKDFGKQCYTTEQVTNLCVLFLTDKGRYDFFDAAYPHVSDTGNFPKLISKLSDEYYINRFKAMIRR